MTVTAITNSRVQSAIQLASSKTGVDFGYLLGQAKLESGLRSDAHASTSSASGLYQFIDQSWLAIVKKHGAENGLSWAADAIQPGTGGKLSVADGNTKAAILALRNDPATASMMAAEYASDNKDALQGTLGRSVTGTDLYMAHFLGLGGAKKFLSTMQATPDASGAALFPAAAAANRSVFYGSDGTPRSLSQIYARFAAKLDGSTADAAATAAANTGFAAQALDMNGATVVTGAGESATDALAWASATLGKFGRGTGAAGTTAASLLRPTPDTARLAYLMLARMGG
ncbi:lytic transglycosylase domain-containing protein [Sphingomonas sp. CROZ-RG-20F-R02-07]|uniref:lytic transglycosylase domain-containing protein n=1 Tax=Sphingomonas sp. CROZ-RG-20F-R02-07 TaxID=2914832 RepID=UPI001F5AF09B|nr:lytic transglycosylase domain-containing protein [Sphingomonas sp. CROZ-RG-20F-R02-07]